MSNSFSSSPSSSFFLFFLITTSSVFNNISPSFSHLLAPITKDYKTNLYTISLYLNSPSQSTNLLLDLGASFSWLNSTHKCTTPHRLRSSITSAGAGALALHTTDGRSPGDLVIIPEIIFSCSSNPSLLKGIHKAKNFAGVAGLGRSNASLSDQISATASRPALFALCLSGSPSAPGVAFFNSHGPYYFLPEIDLSKLFNYTPLLSSPAKRHTVKNPLHRSDEYFIGVKDIQVNGKSLNINHKILTVDRHGTGGTIISTVAPYTILHKSINKALTKSFVKESGALNLTVTNPVRPFSVCYAADQIGETSVGPVVPSIDLVMDGGDVKWSIVGANSMVRIVKEEIDVWCLGFVTGGSVKSRAAITIGGHQMEDNMLQFDVGNKRVGFTNSVLAHNTMCANFNFTNHGRY